MVRLRPWHSKSKRSGKFFDKQTQPLPSIFLSEDMVDSAKVNGKNLLRIRCEGCVVFAAMEERLQLLECRSHCWHSLVLNLPHGLARSTRLGVSGQCICEFIDQSEHVNDQPAGF